MTTIEQRDNWMGLKPVASRILASPLVHVVARRVLPGRLLHRLPVREARVNYRLKSGATIKLLNPLEDQIAKDIHWGGGKPTSVADAMVLEYVEATAPQVGTFLDIGTYSGLFAMIAAKTNPRLESVAYEILPENYAATQRNIAANGLAVDVKLVGLSDNAGEILMPSDFGSVSHPSSISLGDQFDDGVAVPVTTLDAEGYSGPMLWKIDVEGFEANVIRGGAGTIAASRPIIICEILQSSRAHGAIEALLKSLGYTFQLATERGFQTRQTIEPSKQGRDWLFHP